MRTIRYSALALLLVVAACSEGRLPTETQPVPTFTQLNDTTTATVGTPGPDCWTVSPSLTVTYYAQCPATPVGAHEYVQNGVKFAVLWNRH